MADNLAPQTSFETLKQNVVDSIKSYFPFDGRKNRLQISNLRVDDKSSPDDLQDQASAKDHGTTWGVPIKADIELVNLKSGKVVDTKKNAVLARLPKLTSRYGFIVNGNEYQVDHLFRLKPGVYTRIQDNGDMEAEFNNARARFSVALDQKSKQFTLKIGGSHTPLYPILKAAGVSDDTIEKDWGRELFQANIPRKAQNMGKALAKFYAKTSAGDSTDPKDHALHVPEFFDQINLNPEVTNITLGKPFSKVNGEVLQRAANRLLDVSRGGKPDDRDSLVFKEVAAVEDFIPEKILRANKSIHGRLRNTMDKKENIDDILSSKIFNQPIHDFFTKGGGVAELSDQTNPIAMLSAHRKTTLMGRESGGIKNKQLIGDEMRIINPSQFGFLDPMHTPESEKTGITLHLAAGARKNGKNLEAPVYNLATGQKEWLKVDKFHASSIVLPDQVKWENGKPRPIAEMVKVKKPGGAIEHERFSAAQYVMPSAKGMFDYASNLIPFLPSDQGNRVSMADKQIEQAISLKHREAPLVQSKTDSKDPTHTFEKFVGEFVAALAPAAGTITQVKADGITLTDGKTKHHIEIYHHFPLNDSKGMMHSTPLVKVGDKVEKGQVIADTNFTRGGTLAVGTNLRVGYLPYKGYNYEDGIVISDAASKKLVSEHLYKKDLELDPTVDHISKPKYLGHAQVKAAKMTKDHKAALDEEGVIKPGSRVEPGQVMVTAVSKNTLNKASSVLAGLNRGYTPYKDKSLYWDEDHVGIVTKVVRQPNGKGVRVYVTTEEPAVVGDKLSGRHGNKGIITQILPDDEMPHTLDAKGERRPLEVILNPSGVPTRINAGQMLETAVAKVAEKTGKPFVVDNFAGPSHDYRGQVLEELKKHGLTDEELVYDPDDPKHALGSVLVGPQYLLKLKHQVEKKLTVRGGGTDINGKPLKYDPDNQPVKGSESGGQGFGQLDLYALLGHNARANLREMATYKSDKQDARFWSWVQEGREPPPPRPPFSYEKFTSLLKGLGVNVERVGTAVRLMPMTNKEILKLADNGKNELKEPQKTLRAKDLREEAGGLFDPQATGGKDGSKWSFIRLAEPLPNPIFVGSGNRPGPIPVLLGLELKDVNAIMEGKKELDGKVGGHAIESALKKIDPKVMLRETLKLLPTLTKSDLDRANKKVKFLQALNELDLKPHEAYVLHNIPVVPPKFRPVTPTPGGDVNYASLNGLYKNLALINNELKDFDSSIYEEEFKHPLRAKLWDAAKAMQSVGDYKSVYDTDNSGNRELRGILHTIGGGEGKQPKQSFFQSKLIKRRQNLSIRSTIVPEPALGIDEVGLPRHAAMELYKPFVMAQLSRQGYRPLPAETEIKNGTAVAQKALERVIEDRPILLKRDPVLHKFSIMAFKPKLVEGKAIHIHPLVTGGFNADFDGDTMAGTVPLSREAVEEAKKMFPSQNLFSPTSGQVMYLPSQEALLGLHLLSKWGKPSSKTFDSIDELKTAQEKHEIGLNDVVKLKGAMKETTLGRLLIAKTLPGGFAKNVDILHDPTYEINKKSLNDIATRLAKNHTPEFAKSINAMKDLGNEQSFRYGFSIGLKDLAPVKGRDEIIERANKEVAVVRAGKGDRAEQDKKVVEIYEGATKNLDEAIKKHLNDGSNRLATMVFSGARGKMDQLRQMIAAPMLMQNSLNETIPQAVTKSYAEGLDVGDYFLAQHGARKGTMQRALGTSEPGRLSKDILNTTIATLITSPDCHTNQGVQLDVSHKDTLDRFLARPLKLRDGTMVREGTLLTSEVLGRIRNSTKDPILVRSPLKCAQGEGICAKCFGIGESGKLHDVGTNIGALAGQSLGEPAVQMAMDAFHCNHAHSIVFVRGFVGHDLAPTLEELWDLIPSPVEEDGGKEFKEVHDLEIFDGEWVELKKLCRHRPDRPLVSVSSQRTMTICQDNHPIAVRKNNVSCPGCGHHLVKKPSPASRGTKSYCPKCGVRFEKPEHVVGEAGFLSPVEIEKGRVYLNSNLDPDLRRLGGHDLPYNPYLVGAFIAEGSVRVYAQVTSREKKPYAVNISQNEGPIKDKIVDLIPDGIGTSRNSKSVTLHSLQLGTEFLGLFGRWSRNKSLPNDFIHYSKKWKATFLCGLIDGDGTAKHAVDGPDQINIDTTSFTLAQQVLFICSELGITASIYLTTRRKLTRHQGYKVALTMTESATGLLAESIKVVERVKKLSPTPFKTPNEYRLASKVNVVFYTQTHVYDVQTSSGTVFVSGLKSHNSGGVASSERGAKSVDRFSRLDQLLQMPAKLRDSATISNVDGKITAIKKDAVGGVDVHVNGVSHYVPKHLVDDYLKVGTDVKKGTKLSQGFINPHELLQATKDIHSVQGYLTGEMYDGLYEKEGVRRRNVEVAVRALTNLTRIKDPGSSDYLHGDIAARSVVEEHNRSLPPGEAAISHEPLLKGITQIPSNISRDWMARLNYRELPATIQQGAATAAKSELHGSHPVPGIAYGAEFGKPPPGKPKHVY